MRNAHSILIGRPEGMTPLGRTGHRWWIKLKWHIEIGYGSVDWVHLA
jgi:hypothetical protein